jgi:hypothetical protein
MASNDYLPTTEGCCYSIAAWGSKWNFPRVPNPPELNAYQMAPYLNRETIVDINTRLITDILAVDYSFYGLGNIFNSMHLLKSVYTDFIKGDGTTPSQYWTDTITFY